jgi:hypothetical protein
MRWGLIPHWAEEEKMAYKMINARVETLAQRPAFRSLLVANRCLVPASGFYEWKTDGREKTPYYIYPKSNQFFSPEKVLRWGLIARSSRELERLGEKNHQGIYQRFVDHIN